MAPQVSFPTFATRTTVRESSEGSSSSEVRTGSMRAWYQLRSPSLEARQRKLGSAAKNPTTFSRSNAA